MSDTPKPANLEQALEQLGRAIVEECRSHGFQSEYDDYTDQEHRFLTAGAIGAAKLILSDSAHWRKVLADVL